MNINEKLDNAEEALDEASGILDRLVSDPELRHMFDFPSQPEIEVEGEQ